MTEHVFSRKLRKALDHKVHYQWKINDPYTNGVPDRFIEGTKCDLWLEAKHIKTLPVRDTTMIDLCNPNSFLSMLQQNWLMRRHITRGDAAVLLSCGEKATIFFDAEWKIPLTKAQLSLRLVPLDTIVDIILTRIN